ncbi:hypothetical protein [Paraburkholderia sp.]
MYEQKADLFFLDLSGTIVIHAVLQRLVTFPNAIVTGHRPFSRAKL